MRFKSEFVTSALQDLERQIKEFRGYVNVAATAVGQGDAALAVAGLTEMRHLFELINATAMTIKDEVVPADGLGNTMGSVAELVIRAMQMVITAQVGVLRAEICDASALDRAQAMFTGRLEGIDDLASFLHAEFDRINALWLTYRSDGENKTGASEQRVLYRAAIRAAHRTVREIGRDPDFAHLLREGVARIEWPAVHCACAQIAATISVNIDAEVDRSLAMHSQRLHPIRTPTRKP